MFATWGCCCIAMAGHIGLGLDQKLSMPHDSYVLTYFESLNKYLSVGSPVYFVVERGHNYTDLTGQDMVCGANGCPEYSLVGQVYKAAQQPKGLVPPIMFVIGGSLKVTLVAAFGFLLQNFERFASAPSHMRSLGPARAQHLTGIYQ